MTTLDNEKTFIIAEVGINHNGSFVNCCKLIDAASGAGCQAAKFQLFSAKYLYPKSAGCLDWKDENREYSYNIYDAVKKFEMPLEWVDELLAYCKDKGLEFLSSVFDVHGLDFILNKGVQKIKLSSYTITNLPLIEECAQAKLPIIMSTGGASLSETEEAVNSVLKYHDNLTLLHCSIQYPVTLADCNLGVIELLRFAFPTLRVGLSDHSSEISAAAIQAVYLGGTVVEKHITLDKKMDGPDHFFALEPDELATMVRDIRCAEQNMSTGDYLVDNLLYGSSARVCHENEQYLRDFCYMTLFAARNIQKGEQIRSEDLLILRPGKKKRGLDPKFIKLFAENEIIARENVGFEEPIQWSSIL